MNDWNLFFLFSRLILVELAVTWENCLLARHLDIAVEGGVVLHCLWLLLLAPHLFQLQVVDVHAAGGLGGPGEGVGAGGVTRHPGSKKEGCLLS